MSFQSLGGKGRALAIFVAAIEACLGLSSGSKALGEEELPILVVTPLRSPLALSRSGSAITIVQREEIEAWGAKSLADVLRGAPGVDITEQGGPGSLSYLSLRGAGADRTLVMIDGMRVGDAASIGGSFDFSTLSATDIERIEILRGPQSALYGSDAMGGVINIVTRRGKATPKTVLQIEGGSYGTLATTLSTSRSTDKLSYRFSIHGFHTDGFSRFGYRIGRITSQLGRPLERDKTNKAGGSAHVTYRPTPGTEIELGYSRYASFFHFDNPGAFSLSAKDSRLNKGRQDVSIAFAKINNVILDGRLKNSLTFFGNETNRFNRVEQQCYDAFFFSYDCDVRFRSRRIGLEYQGDLKLGTLGTLIFGARHEQEQASNNERWLSPLLPSTTLFRGRQTTNSFFALHQATIAHLDLSLGGRIDNIDGQNTFPTWRATAAYRIPLTRTKFRASIGTGAKAATLFQRFSIYGTPGLEAEQNLGYEIGFDQNVWAGRATLSVTAFETRYRNLIDFDFTGNAGIGAYFNVGRAKIRGVEVSAALVAIPEILKMRASYTYLQSLDQMTGLPLIRRPRHKGFVSASYTGIPKLQIEGKLSFVGSRIDIQNDFPYSRIRMAPYAKVDARISYQLREKILLYLRAENLTNTRYEEIRDFGTAGRSIYAGARITW